MRSLKTCLRLSSKHSWKRDSSLKILLTSQRSFSLIGQGTTLIGLDLRVRIAVLTLRSRRCTGVRGKHHNGLSKHKYFSLSHVSRVMLDTWVQVTRWAIDNNESGTVIAFLTIALSSRSTMFIGHSDHDICIAAKSSRFPGKLLDFCVFSLFLARRWNLPDI